MSILREIQAEILQSDKGLGSILLKLRFLAARLESEPLADWVKFETEGYPREAKLPDYRYVGVSYKGTFSGTHGSGVQNAPIPTLIVQKFAGKDWVRKGVTESISAIDDLARSEELGIDASNLILKLQGNVYPEMACISIDGAISPIAMKEIINVVRSRVLELTLEVEKRIPGAVDVTVAKSLSDRTAVQQTTTDIFKQTVYGGVAR